MKVQGINNYSQKYFLSSNKKNTKQENLSFQGVITQDKMKKFVPELGTFLFNTADIKIKNIENFLKKFRPKLKVNFASLNSIYGRAQAQTIMGLNPYTLIPTIDEQIIDLTVNKADSFEEKIQLFDWLVHEMTHIYQSDLDSDEESANLVNIKYLREKILQNPTDETVYKVKEKIEKVQKIFHELEFVMLRVLETQGVAGKPVYQPIKNFDVLDIESTYYNAFGKTSQQFIRDFVNEKIKEYGIDDKKFAEKIIRAQANNEVEAYDTSLKAVKEILNINGASSNDFIKYVFQIISRLDLNG